MVDLSKATTVAAILVCVFGHRALAANSVISTKSCSAAFDGEQGKRQSLVVQHETLLDPAAVSPLGYKLALPYSSLPAGERAALLNDFSLNSIGVVNTGLNKPFRATATYWGQYGDFVLLKTAKHVADAGIQFFDMGGLGGMHVVRFDVAANHGVKLFDDPVTDVTVYGFSIADFPAGQMDSLQALVPSFLPLASELLKSPGAELVVAGRASQPSAVSDGSTFSNLGLYSQDASAIWQSTATEANAPENLDSRPAGAQGDVLAVAKTSLVSPYSARIPDPDGIVPVTGGATTNPQQPYLASALISQVYAFDYRSVGRMSGGSVLMHAGSGRARDVASHITKGLPQNISNLDLKHPFGTWETEKDTGGKPTGKYRLLTPAPYAYASDYTTFAKQLAVYLAKNASSLPREQAIALATLLAEGLKP